MACCCKGGTACNNPTSCLGRCDLPKHRCLDKEEIKPGPVPRYMGWLWDARTAPEHQLRCGWRPGHISCPVLRTIENHNSCTRGECCGKPCRNSCSRCCPPLTPCRKPCCPPSSCAIPCFGPISSCTKSICCSAPPVIRIIRRGGNYNINTKPSDISNAPTGPCPLKYVLNVDPDDKPGPNVKYSVEAKFNDYYFDYTTSQTSFVLDFTPPEHKCRLKPCPNTLVTCLDPCPKC